LFKFLRSSVSKAAPLQSAGPESAPSPSTSTQQHTDIKRELIRVVLKDTLRLHGIPFDWLACEIIIVPHGPDEEDLHIQLVLMKWHETFLRYAPALEQQLLRGLDRFDPLVDHSKYIISWRFSRDCGCPFAVMPPPLVWSHQDAPVAAVEDEAPSILDRRHAKRPAKGTAPADESLEPAVNPPPWPPKDDEYQRTQLSPLR
jgi:hypothetical protein